LAKAQAEQSDEDLAGRLATLQALEAELITSPDPVFRFHSGVPVSA
jgi:tRNA-(ms[2]io[6]A)-hydroxylase